MTVVRRRLNSIAVRLALWYGLSAFALVVVTTGSLYWALTVNLDREDALTLENHIQDLRLLLAAVTPDAPMTAPPVNGLSLQTNQQIFVRLVDGSGASLFETPGLLTWTRAPTTDRFGPLRQVTPDLVFELAFAGTRPNPRRKCGLDLVDAVLVRWHRDLSPDRATDLRDIAGAS